MVSGAVYMNNEKIQELVGEVYKIASYTNPLHSDIFPGICKMEAEIVRIACRLFHGDDNSGGTVSWSSFNQLLINFSKEVLF